MTRRATGARERHRSWPTACPHLFSDLLVLSSLSSEPGSSGSGPAAVQALPHHRAPFRWTVVSGQAACHRGNSIGGSIDHRNWRRRRAPTSEETPVTNRKPNASTHRPSPQTHLSTRNRPTRNRPTGNRPTGNRKTGSEATRRERGRSRKTVLLVGAAVVIVAAIAIGLAVPGGGAKAPIPPASAATGVPFSGPPGPEGVPLEVGTVLAPAATAATGRTINDIQCDASEQVVYHVHTRLTVYDNGTLRPLPAGIGIVSPVAQETAAGPFYGATRCYYWLHVHAQDGVIHIESPSVRKYTLGDFFAIWQQPLTARQVGPLTGNLTVFVNGRRYRGDPAFIPLGSHEDIQIDVGTPVIGPKTIDWAATGL